MGIGPYEHDINDRISQLPEWLKSSSRRTLPCGVTQDNTDRKFYRCIVCALRRYTHSSYIQSLILFRTLRFNAVTLQNLALDSVPSQSGSITCRVFKPGLLIACEKYNLSLNVYFDIISSSNICRSSSRCFFYESLQSIIYKHYLSLLAFSCPPHNSIIDFII
jgi:hypothetical protein